MFNLTSRWQGHLTWGRVEERVRGGGGWLYGGKDTDEATILPGGFSHSLEVRSSSVTPRHEAFMIMQTGRLGGKWEQGGKSKERRVASMSFIFQQPK